VLNILGTAILGVFISWVSAIFSLIECTENPNRKQTLRGYSYVECQSSEHTAMVPVMILSLLGVVAVLAVISMSLFVAPKRFGSTEFRIRVSCLTKRYRAATYWYSLVVVCRSLALSMSTVIFTASGYEQIDFIGSVVVLAIVVHLCIWPYEDFAANIYELVSLLGTAIILVCCSFFLNEDRSGSETGSLASNLAVAMIFIFVAVLGTGLAVKVFALSLVISPQKQTKRRTDKVECLRPVVKQLGAELSRMQPETLETVLDATSFMERWCIRQVVQFFELEVKGTQTQKVHQQRLPLVYPPLPPGGFSGESAAEASTEDSRGPREVYV
jgi:hypothetical protein